MKKQATNSGRRPMLPPGPKSKATMQHILQNFTKFSAMVDDPSIEEGATVKACVMDLQHSKFTG